jgi:hypothetical protein
MRMSEIGDAVQIIRLSYDGIEIAMKIGAGGVQAAKKAVEFLIGLLDHDKALGQTSTKKLLRQGGDLQVMQFPEKDMKKVKRLAKKYGILYSVLPEANRKDGMMEILFHTEAVPRANMLLKKLKEGKITGFDDFLQHGDKDRLNDLFDYFKSLKSRDGSKTEDFVVDSLTEKVGKFAMQKKAVSAETVAENFEMKREEAKEVLGRLTKIGVLEEADKDGIHRVVVDGEAFQKRIQSYQELAARMKVAAAQKNTDMIDITISKTLVSAENDHAVRTRVPGTWGSGIRYLWLKKSELLEIYGGKTLLAYLDQKKDYKLYDESNRVVETIKGEELYRSHYDKVVGDVRKRYEKTEKHTHVQTVEKTKTR